MEKQTSLSADRLAKPSRSPESAKASWMSEASSCSNTSELFEKLNPLTASGKTSPVSCRRTEDGHLLPSKGNWKTAGMRSRGECWTRNLPEWPSDAAVSFLSDVLIQDAPQRYSLSPIACAGIIRRAERRGRSLPEPLGTALAKQAALNQTEK